MDIQYIQNINVLFYYLYNAMKPTSSNLYPPPWPHSGLSLSPPMQPLSESPILELTEQMESI